jgi:Transglutaminase-like superfamily
MGCWTCYLPMWERFRRFSVLDPEARMLFFRAAALLPFVGMSLRTRGYKKTQAWLQKRLESRSTSALAAGSAGELVHRTCRMVRAAEHHGLTRATCLEESLALWYLLGRQNISSRIRIGVRKQAGKFEAHAWVEYEGEALNQSEELHRHYAPFASEFDNLPVEKS